jgi:hypothetical protein
MKTHYNKYLENFRLLNSDQNTLVELREQAKQVGFTKARMTMQSFTIYCHDKSIFERFLDSNEDEISVDKNGIKVGHIQHLNIHPHIFTITFKRAKRFTAMFTACYKNGMRAIHPSECICDVLEAEGEITQN